MSRSFTPLPAYRNRREAGQSLAAALRPVVQGKPIVLALPRGGVPVAYEVARSFDSPLDLVMVRKIGAPGHEEFAIGAVVDGLTPQWVVDQRMAAQFDVPRSWFEEEKQRQLEEIERRRAVYCGDRPPLDIAGREVIVVDDGVVTGNTAKAALTALTQSGPDRLIFAVPVGAQDSLDELRPMVDELVCPLAPDQFRAVGQHYQDFGQTTDAEVVDLLGKAREALR
ncbi:Predicted phosphoribosyltransferase [Halopseudomonas xinjiangensis]|uniref:Predicted phosphoribosyltransferase n=1 Tax=Halopseudomonas xinjiangensis TaxID=487184 RepID=A0A1H1MT90_9GAMM|nr:phosphoribosyltransferase [Halopseudomonas xinjiangensis]SDR90113.1 Predicted phosphoribosyltransferase [Halopseudomonas xinjiangensis]